MSTPGQVLQIAVAVAVAVATLAGCAGAPPLPPPPPPPVSAPPLPAPAPQPPSAGGVLPTASPGVAAAAPAGFARWVAEMRTRAQAAGITEATLRITLDDLHYLPQVVERDRAQPEVTRTVWDYLDRAVTPARIARGQDKLRELHAELDAAAARHGVPPAIVVAIWGLESNFGANYGDIPTLSALATLGFDGRREDWARGQLLAALKIVQNGDIAPERMRGSWAGAMGQTQFLPSSFLAYALDADGDGRRDIWGSMADVTASTANFLARAGWQAGQPWGAELRLPAGFDAGRADPRIRQPSTYWEAEGLRSMAGAPLPGFADGAVLLPAGARGPAFLVGPNFRAILRYNNSTSYALAVALLAQRLVDGPGVQAPWPREQQALSRSQVLALQQALNQRGFASGAPDGIAGPATRDAIRAYQRSAGLPADGHPDLALLQRLQQR